MIKLLISYFKPHKKIFILDMLCAVIAALIDVAFPIISRYAMYDLLPNKAFKAFFTLMSIVGIAYVLRAVCYYVMTYWGHTFGVRVEADIREDLFRHLQTLDFEFYDQNRTGALISRLTGDLFDITELAHHGPEDLLISVLTIMGALTVMFSIEWRLALVVLVLLPIFLFVIIRQRTNMSETSKNVKAKMATINSDIESSISGIKTAKAFANEIVEKKRFDSANNQYRTAKKDFYHAMGLFNASQEFFMGIMPAVVIAVGGCLIMMDEMNYIDLITFTLFVSTFITPVRKLTQFAEIFASGYAGLQRFDNVMKMQPTVPENENACPLTVKTGKIDINHIDFHYADSRQVLNDIDLHVHSGEMIAVVGSSGGGKTTLCQLIPRFYDVTNGSITIDDTDIRDVTKESLRSVVGIVQQEVFIFPDTIMENIRYGRPNATDEEVVMAAREAELYDDILEMKDGFSTYVGERGTRLSGGQRQRISIARIFLKDPRILILDEATSALDTVTEQKIQQSFEKLMQGRTSIVIAHRLATVKNADRIVVIEGGSIVEQGTGEELIKENGVYAKLLRTQDLFSSDQ